MNWLGVDIGGAHLKLADARDFALIRPFALWREPHRLADELVALLAGAPPDCSLAATMTGELADCYANKAEGVRQIVSAVCHAAATRRVAIYLVGGQFASPEEALRQPLRTAASNWCALATFAGRFTTGLPSLLIDIGSTTADIIPLVNSAPCSEGSTDPARLAAGELVYTGVKRSPVCALVRTARWRGRRCQIAQELFASSWDAYLVLADLPEEPHSLATCDGRPATRAAAIARLARMVCADESLFTEDEAIALATTVAARQQRLVEHAIARVLSRQGAVERILLSGEGEFLARRAVARVLPGAAVISLSKLLGSRTSQVAPAHALAQLASERLP